MIFTFGIKADWPLQLVGIYANGFGAGKSTVAKEFRRVGYDVVSFATPLKSMIYTLLKSVGIPDDTCYEYIEGKLKQTVIPELGKTPRELMQTLGTEWGRNSIASDVWIRGAESAIKQLDPHPSGKRLVVIDDLRFPNEFYWIKAKGGKTVKLVSPFATQSKHSSEGILTDFPFDYTLENTDDIQTLVLKTQEIIKQCNAFTP